MCTSIIYPYSHDKSYFGRTMDFSYPIDTNLYSVSKDYYWSSINKENIYQDQYNFMGIGQEEDDLLVFFDGVNETGFAAAALYFVGYAKYEENPVPSKSSIAAYDFLHYILGRCSSLNELIQVTKDVTILGIPDPVTQSVAPLHWIATDPSRRCIVIELTESGLSIIENPIGVLTNSPDIMWHNTNLRNYIEVSSEQTNQATWNTSILTPFGQGGGSTLLPGGYTSPARFVRTAFIKSHIEEVDTDMEALMNSFHILESVTIPKGVVLTNKESYDYTKYTAFIQINTQEYYYKTYKNTQIAKVSLHDYIGKSSNPILITSLSRSLKADIITAN